MYRRGSEEFGRVIAFSDGIFAIAMTLLVVGIAVPTISDTDSVGELADALNDQSEAYITFFISFAVIGRYWVAHHQFFSLLGRLDMGLIWINLLFLGFIAFLPFPTDLLGEYFGNPLSVAVYAFAIGIVSWLEVVMLKRAQDASLFEVALPQPIYRWAVLASGTPVLFFALSIPVAFLSTTAAVLLWLGPIPLAVYMRRHQPEGVDRYLSRARDPA
jgi:uncharacterized membrane protein